MIVLFDDKIKIAILTDNDKVEGLNQILAEKADYVFSIRYLMNQPISNMNFVIVVNILKNRQENYRVSMFSLKMFLTFLRNIAGEKVTLDIQRQIIEDYSEYLENNNTVDKNSIDYYLS